MILGNKIRENKIWGWLRIVSHPHSIDRVYSLQEEVQLIETHPLLLHSNKVFMAMIAVNGAADFKMKTDRLLKKRSQLLMLKVVQLFLKIEEWFQWLIKIEIYLIRMNLIKPLTKNIISPIILQLTRKQNGVNNRIFCPQFNKNLLL